MTDPIPDEAVEPALRAWFEYERTAHPASTLGDRMRATLTAAAPIIAAQAKAMPAENLEIVNGWLVERGAHDLDYPAGAAYGPYPNSDAEPLVKLDELPGWPGDAADLRAGIEALRDEWRTEYAYRQEQGIYPSVHYRAHADALDALLREGK